MVAPEIPAWPALVCKNLRSNTGRDSPPENCCIRRRLRTLASAAENTGAHQQNCQAAAVLVLASARPVQAVSPTLACKQGTPPTVAEAFSVRDRWREDGTVRGDGDITPLHILRYSLIPLPPLSIFGPCAVHTHSETPLARPRIGKARRSLRTKEKNIDCLQNFARRIRLLGVACSISAAYNQHAQRAQATGGFLLHEQY